MKRKFFDYVETKLVLVAVLGSCLWGGTTYGLYNHLVNVRFDTEELVASNIRARHLVQTLTIIQDAETGQRGFLLTSHDDYLQPYIHAVGHIDQYLANLQRDYAHTDREKSIVAAIDQDAREKFAELKQTVELRRNSGLDAALRIVLQGTGKRLMDMIRANVSHLLEAERARIDSNAIRQQANAGRNVEFWGWTALMMLFPAGLILVLAFRDARHGRREGARLFHSSNHDELTGLLNRPAFIAQLNASLLRHPKMVGLLYIDLNGFKAINDELGHSIGDNLLVEVAKCLKETLRPVDVIARLGGDEFVVVVEDCPNPHLLKILADRVETTIQEIRLPELGRRRIGGSVGIAYSSEDINSAASLLEAADAAMYQRKSEHRRTRTTPFRPHLSIV